MPLPQMEGSYTRQSSMPLPSPVAMPVTPGTPGGAPSLMTPIGVTKISAEQGLERLEQVWGVCIVHGRVVYSACVMCVRARVRACLLRACV